MMHRTMVESSTQRMRSGIAIILLRAQGSDCADKHRPLKS